MNSKQYNYTTCGIVLTILGLSKTDTHYFPLFNYAIYLLHYLIKVILD